MILAFPEPGTSLYNNTLDITFLSPLIQSFKISKKEENAHEAKHNMLGNFIYGK